MTRAADSNASSLGRAGLLRQHLVFQLCAQCAHGGLPACRVSGYAAPSRGGGRRCAAILQRRQRRLRSHPRTRRSRRLLRLVLSEGPTPLLRALLLQRIPLPPQLLRTRTYIAIHRVCSSACTLVCQARTIVREQRICRGAARLQLGLRCHWSLQRLR